ncbi:unnamed protein product [Oppiella nova]|uniref:Uncharacterized protein n=1 Tax=Oppiella nova TaxID=334625 RepID=A0A7R9M1N7_9ACAR|nr:unnamed protein product [Oppiella nova]CAG2169050.1 unnamed protein product [Oppiella nova]
MSNSKDFNGKVVLITGSSGGIGATTAIEFSRNGANVVITGRNANNLSEVGKECQNVSPKGLPPLEVVADVSKDDDCKRLIDSTIKIFGKLDVLVNNAGFGMGSLITDANILDKYKQIMDTNLRSVVYLTHLSVEHLEKTKGNIINMSSVASMKPFCGFSLYSMSKCALDMFTKCLALELGPKGIRVNTIKYRICLNYEICITITERLSVSPGHVRTNFLQVVGYSKSQSDARYDELANKYPLARVGESKDIANAVLFMASSESSFVTGINFLSDGGALYSNI